MKFKKEQFFILKVANTALRNRKNSHADKKEKGNITKRQTEK